MNFRNRKLVRTVQIVLGLIILFLIANTFFMFMPAPQLNEAATAWFTAMMATGYLLPLMTAVFIVCALTFIFDKWSAFGAVLLAPVTVNILAYHIFLDWQGWTVAFVFAILNIYLLAVHWPRYKPMFAR